ncbi:MAG: hypothetical protein MZW92_24625 [Comamonadaceae bacterium]|nr:hypothetical protein [Comamonadaceae bacterium]
MGPPASASAGADRAAEDKDGGQILRHPAPARKDADDAAFAQLQAQAAHAGAALHRLASGGYMVARWGLSRELLDLAAVGAFLRQMGCVLEPRRRAPAASRQGAARRPAGDVDGALPGA